MSEKVKLKEIAKLQGGYAFKSQDFVKDEIPVIKIGNISDNRVIVDNNTTVMNQKLITEHPEFIIKKDDILIAMSGATVGKIGIYDEEKISLLNQRVGKFVTNEKIKVKYLYYVLQSTLFKKYILNNAFGCAQPNISGNQIEEFEFKIYSIIQQNEIIDQLDRISKVIELKKKQLNDIDELIKSQFVELFGDINNNTKNFKVVSLKECCKKITDGTHDTPKRYETGVLLITGKNIRENHFDLTNIEYVSEEDHKKIYARCNPEKGDILYTNIGVNYCTAMVNPFEYEFSMKNVALLKPNFSIIDSFYFSYALNYLKSKIVEKNKGAGAQTFIGLSAIAEIEIPIPDLQLQNVFEKFVKQIDKQKFEIQKSLNEMNCLYESLMDNYFGE